MSTCAAVASNGALCELEGGHGGYHSGRSPEGYAVAWPSAVILQEREIQTRELVARAAWEPHRFPERRRDGKPRYMTRDVKRAKAPYPCESIDLAPGHREVIQPGEQYVRVRIPPQDAGGFGRWRAVRLCGACALAYELVTLNPQPPGGG